MQGTSSGGGGSEPSNFMEIWEHNLDEGFDKIRNIVQKYPYVAMVSCTLCCTTHHNECALIGKLLVGYRISRCGGQAYWGVQEPIRLSVPTAQV